MIEIVFYVSAVLLIYSTIGYGPVLYAISLFFPKKKGAGRTRRGSLPSLSLLISAYNEENVMRQKIENTLELDYPEGKVQVIVISDGSDDRTDDIVAEYKEMGVVLSRVDGRVGKNAAINRTWGRVTGDIVVFSDANSLYDKGSLKCLAGHFSDPEIGCVCGELAYVDAGAGAGKGEGLYWRYEQRLKKIESSMGRLLIANGSIFAVRHKLFRPLDPRIANDFQTPQDAASEGFNVIYEPEAVARERTPSGYREEFERKVRIISRGFEGVFRMLFRFRGIRLFELLSHKVLRWLNPFFLLLIFVSSLVLIGRAVFAVFFILQAVFYAAAILGLLLRKTELAVIQLPSYFLMVNAAAFLGFFRFITRKTDYRWKKAETAR